MRCDAMRCDACARRCLSGAGLPRGAESFVSCGRCCWSVGGTSAAHLKVRVRRVWGERNTRHSRPQNQRAHGAEWGRGQRVDRRAPRAGNDVERRPLCTGHVSVSSRLIAPTHALRIEFVRGLQHGVAIVSPPSVGSGKPLTGVALWQCVPSIIWALECRC